MELKLHRDRCTIDVSMGVLTIEGLSLMIQTLERPWVPSDDYTSGQPGRSCVSVGTYDLVRHDSEAHPQTWALVNPALGVIHEPDPTKPFARVACLFHPANFVYELRGCIAPGLLRVGDTVHRSRDAFNSLKLAVPWTDGHTLTITGGTS